MDWFGWAAVRNLAEHLTGARIDFGALTAAPFEQSAEIPAGWDEAPIYPPSEGANVKPGANLPDAVITEPLDGEAWFAEWPKCETCGGPNTRLRHTECMYCRWSMPAQRDEAAR